MRVFLAAPPDLPADVAAAFEGALAAAGHEVARAPPPAAGPVAAGLARPAFEAAHAALQDAEVVVAEASRAATEVGWALAWQLARGGLAIVCVREDARAALPALVAGNPSPWQRLVIYRGASDLEARLADLLG